MNIKSLPSLGTEMFRLSLSMRSPGCLFKEWIQFYPGSTKELNQIVGDLNIPVIAINKTKSKKGFMVPFSGRLSVSIYSEFPKHPAFVPSTIN